MEIQEQAFECLVNEYHLPLSERKNKSNEIIRKCKVYQDKLEHLYEKHRFRRVCQEKLCILLQGSEERELYEKCLALYLGMQQLMRGKEREKLLIDSHLLMLFGQLEPSYEFRRAIFVANSLYKKCWNTTPLTSDQVYHFFLIGALVVLSYFPDLTEELDYERISVFDLFSKVMQRLMQARLSPFLAVPTKDKQESLAQNFLVKFASFPSSLEFFFRSQRVQ